MAYFNSSEKPMNYNGVIYKPGDEIPDFGVGKYDDLLLASKKVESNGEGNGNEGKISHQKERRAEMWARHESMQREEAGDLADFSKYQVDRDRVRA